MSFRAITQGMPPYPEPQLKGYVSSHNSMNIPASQPLRYHQSLVDHAHPRKQIINHAFALSPGVALEPPDEIRLQTA